MNGTTSSATNGAMNGSPTARKPTLVLCHPTQAEIDAIWAKTAGDWGKALGLDGYIEREQYLWTKVPLNQEGLTHWVLVDGSLPPYNRPILASCESLRKSALVSSDGVIKEVITHGIGSVFCDPVYRGKGYAGKMLELLGPALQHWQTDKDVPGRETCPFTILYSDIGKKFYTKLGWHPHSAKHITFAPSSSISDTSLMVEQITSSHQSRIREICDDDMRRIKAGLALLKRPGVALIPSYEQIQWHHMREDFITKKLFRASPEVKGASCVVGDSRITAFWTHSYYGPVDDPNSGNTLYILRLIVDSDRDADENAKCLKGILQLAQREAHLWKSQQVELWNPSSYVLELVRKTCITHKIVDRQDESIPSLMWYGPDGKGSSDDVDWLYNEKFGWC